MVVLKVSKSHSTHLVIVAHDSLVSRDYQPYIPLGQTSRACEACVRCIPLWTTAQTELSLRGGRGLVVVIAVVVV